MIITKLFVTVITKWRLQNYFVTVTNIFVSIYSQNNFVMVTTYSVSITKCFCCAARTATDRHTGASERPKPTAPARVKVFVVGLYIQTDRYQIGDDGQEDGRGGDVAGDLGEDGGQRAQQQGDQPSREVTELDEEPADHRRQTRLLANRQPTIRIDREAEKRNRFSFVCIFLPRDAKHPRY